MGKKHRNQRLRDDQQFAEEGCQHTSAFGTSRVRVPLV